MSLKIQPENFIFDNINRSSSIDFTLENDGDTDVSFKFRGPTTNAVAVSDPTGILSPSESIQLRLDYFPEMNEPRNGLIAIQLKYIAIADDMDDIDDVFNSHKDKEKKRILSVGFGDSMDDDLFKSPTGSQVHIAPVVRRPRKARWWNFTLCDGR